METELHGKISDGLPGLKQQQIVTFRIQDQALIRFFNPIQVGQITVIFSQLFKAVLGNFSQKCDGVPPGFDPTRRVNPSKKFNGVFFPAPPHVAGQCFKKSKVLRYIRMNLICLKIFHIF